MKAKEDDRVRLLVEMKGDFGEHLPVGTEGFVTECFSDPEGYAIDVSIPDTSKIGGHRYDSVEVFPAQFEVVIF